jgi:predicted glycoside hydrolase/deacetylase ChbG (UPF0249 family)
MLIVNADDWGGSRSETDAAMACFVKGRITSVTAMVFMADSERAAELAKQSGIDVGLHLNLDGEFTGNRCPADVREHHARIRRFLKRSKYACLLYNPSLRKSFRRVYQVQAEEFQQLYGRRPSHIDGHHHMHLCTNMLLDGVIPAGERVRRSFSFWRSEKGIVNRTYRRLVDNRLAGRYRVTDFFFSLELCLQWKKLGRVAELARAANVELMTHPCIADESAYLMSDAFLELKRTVAMGTFGML